ncbi:Copine [Phytophthora cactorum]|nr:Copine [Phytophthora cactorum]
MAMGIDDLFRQLSRAQEFVEYHKITSQFSDPQMKETQFALQALMEIPDQYRTIKAMNYLDRGPYRTFSPPPQPFENVHHSHNYGVFQPQSQQAQAAVQRQQCNTAKRHHHHSALRFCRVDTADVAASHVGSRGRACKTSRLVTVLHLRGEKEGHGVSMRPRDVSKVRQLPFALSPLSAADTGAHQTVWLRVSRTAA